MVGYSHFIPKICLNWPNVVPLVPPERYFDGQVCFYKFLGPLNGENEKKVTKSIFHFAFQATTVSSRCKIFDLNAHFWCSLGPCWGIGICKVVSQCLFVFYRQLEGSKMTSTKICHFSSDSIR